jgi:hypothetical protein
MYIISVPLNSTRKAVKKENVLIDKERGAALVGPITTS